MLPNNSLERTQPQRDFMYDGAMLRRSARSRSAHFSCESRNTSDKEAFL